MAELITQAQYARMRGVSRQAVGARVKQGVIVGHGERGLIDPDEADKALADASMIGHVETGRAKLGNAALDAVGEPTAPVASIDRMPTIHESRAKKAAADAERSNIARDREAIELAVKRGELIPADLVERAWGSIVEQVMTRLGAVPSTLAPRVKSSLPTAEVEVIIRDEIDEALRALAAGKIVAVPITEESEGAGRQKSRSQMKVP